MDTLGPVDKGVISPDEARRRLEHFKFTPDKYEWLCYRNPAGEFPRSNHEIRALISIAQGGEPRDLEKLKSELRESEEKSRPKTILGAMRKINPGDR